MASVDDISSHEDDDEIIYEDKKSGKGDEVGDGTTVRMRYLGHIGSAQGKRFAENTQGDLV